MTSEPMNLDELVKRAQQTQLLVTSPVQHALWAYDQADLIARMDPPYEYGGGHPKPYLPWVKWNTDYTQIVPAAGPDCSGGVDNILWHAGLLGVQEAENTEWLERYGVEGAGHYITVGVIDEPQPGGFHHCWIRFTNLGKPHEYWCATFTGGPVGWITPGSWMDSYHLRHPDGL